MVKQIAKIHNGYMSLNSIPQKGSIFTLHLPLEKN
jgi:signal transduction histidine kinase